MYQRQINHQHRAAFVLLLDCSASMNGKTKLNNHEVSKAEAVALISNLIIDELIERASRYNEVRNYYDIAVLGYNDQSIRSLLPEVLGDGFVSVEYLAKFAPQHKIIHFNQTLENGGVISAPFMFRPWVAPAASGTTPMYEALLIARDLIVKWCARPENSTSFPPVVINITDGECNDANCEDLVTMSQSIKDTHTSDGDTLFINVHLSTYGELVECVVFPPEATFSTECRYQDTLFRMSSTIPNSVEPLVRDVFDHREPGPYRGVAINASPLQLFSILNIGSESAQCARK